MSAKAARSTPQKGSEAPRKKVKKDIAADDEDAASEATTWDLGAVVDAFIAVYVAKNRTGDERHRPLSLRSLRATFNEVTGNEVKKQAGRLFLSPWRRRMAAGMG